MHHGSHYSSSTTDDFHDIDKLSPQDRKKYDDRGDIPGYMIPGYTPGQQHSKY